MGQLVSHCSGHQRTLSIVKDKQCCDNPLNNFMLTTSLSLFDLPPELLVYHILPHVSYIDLCSLSRVNQTLKALIDNNDHLWNNAIQSEMLDEDKHQSQEIMPIFRNAKARFQYLHGQRRKRSWMTAGAMYGCGSRCTFCETLFFKYITIRSSIKNVRPLKRNHRIFMYFFHDELQHNLRHNMFDIQSQLLVAGPVEFFSMYPSPSRCLKCKSKCHFPLDTSLQPRPYNWFISYLPKKCHSERIDVLEVYCPRCERFSLWKRKTQGVSAMFKPPKLYHN